MAIHNLLLGLHIIWGNQSQKMTTDATQKNH
jgi:hypothetical protein